MAHEPTSPLSLHDESQKLFENVHPSLHPVIRFLLKKADNKKVKSERLRRLFENYSHYKMFTYAASRQYLRDVCISQYYILLIRENPNAFYHTSTFSYVVGVNIETNKLFTTRHFSASPFGELILEKGRISFYKCDYRDVRAMAYDIEIDLDLDNSDEIKEKIAGEKRNLSIRVQGDLIVTLNDASIETYKTLIKRQLSMFIAHEISRHIANKIIDIMLDSHLTATIIDNGINRHSDSQSVRVLIPIPLYSLQRKDYSELRKILVKLTKIVKSKLNVEDVKEYLQLKDIKVLEHIEIHTHACCDDFRIVILPSTIPLTNIFVRYFIDGVAFDVVTYESSVENTQKINEITEKLMNEIEIRPSIISFGRHRINVEEALPTQFTAKIDVLNDTRMITFEAPLIVRGSVTFTHPEHATKVLYFDDFVEFNIRSVMNDFTVERLNLYTLNNLNNENVSLEEYIVDDLERWLHDDDDDSDIDEDENEDEEWEEEEEEEWIEEEDDEWIDDEN